MNLMHKCRRSKVTARSAGGNILLFVLITIAVIVFLILNFPFKVGITELSRLRGVNSVEAASLAAARDLSKIVINDPYFGFVGISDAAPVGKATLALDGEPTPVTSINTLMGTARLEFVLAHELESAELIELAQEDLLATREAAKRLEQALAKSIDPNGQGVAKDFNGDPVNAYESAKAAFTGNRNFLPIFGPHELKGFKLSLGWLKNGSTTTTPCLSASVDVETTKTCCQKGCYKAFTDIPAFKENFTFAGVSAEPTLVDARQFMPVDPKKLCSIVRAEVGLTGEKGLQLNNVACAQPSCAQDTTPPGIMRISFAEGLIPGIVSISSLLHDQQLSRGRMSYTVATGGDVPIDKGASLVQSNSPFGEAMPTATGMFALCFHDWLRTAHARTNLDSLLEVVNTDFRTLADSEARGSGNKRFPVFTLEFDRTGKVVVSNCKRNPFIAQTVFQNQCFAMTNPALAYGGTGLTMSCRDEVRNLGTLAGGKHAGQTISGNPVNWCELAYFDGDEDTAFKLGKGSKALGLSVRGNNHGVAGGKSAVSEHSAHFYKADGGELTYQPRKEYYSGGLAVEIQLSPAKNMTP